MKLLLIRHGEIDSNRAKIYSGRSEESLNANGIAQVHSALEQVEAFGIGALYSSPLLRTMQTSSIIAKKVGLTPIVSDAFNEVRMGPWEGLSEAEVAERYPEDFLLWNSRPADVRLPGRETLEELRDRVTNGVFEATMTSPETTIAIVTHVAVIRILLLYAANRPLNDYKQIHVPNAFPIPVEIGHNMSVTYAL